MSLSHTEYRNKRAYDAILAAPFWSPTFKAIPDYFQDPTHDLATHVARFKVLVKMYPKLHIEVVDVSTSIDLEHGMAQVLSNIELAGHLPGLVHRGVQIREWQKTRGQWLRVKLECIRSAYQPG